MDEQLKKMSYLKGKQIFMKIPSEIYDGGWTSWVSVIMVDLKNSMKVKGEPSVKRSQVMFLKNGYTSLPSYKVVINTANWIFSFYMIPVNVNKVGLQMSKTWSPKSLVFNNKSVYIKYYTHTQLIFKTLDLNNINLLPIIKL